MRKRRRSKKSMSLEDGNVNITALMDVLTVLLFFLIKSFTVSSLAIEPPEDVTLPETTYEQEVEESVTVSLSKKELRANNEVLVVLKDGYFSKSDLGTDGRSLPRLEEFLRSEHRKRLSIFEGQGDVSFLPPPKILVQADQNLKFKVIKHLLHTVASSGYTNYQFIVRNPEDTN